MRTTDLFKNNRSSKRLNESLAKTFGTKLDLESFDTPKLEDARNKLRTQIHTARQASGFNETIENETLTQAQFMHDAIVAELMDREEHIVDNSVQEGADFDEQAVVDILKRFDENMNEIGGYGDPDYEKIMSALKQGDIESAIDEVWNSYSDQDGGELRNMDNYIEDLEYEFKDLVGGSDEDEGGETDDNYALASAGFGSDEDYESVETEAGRDLTDTPRDKFISTMTPRMDNDALMQKVAKVVNSPEFNEETILKIVDAGSTITHPVGRYIQKEFDELQYDLGRQYEDYPERVAEKLLAMLIARTKQGVSEGSLDSTRDRLRSQGLGSPRSSNDSDRWEKEKDSRADHTLNSIANRSKMDDARTQHEIDVLATRLKRMDRDDDDWEKTFDMMRDRINRYQWSSQRDVDPEQLRKISDIKYEPKKKNEAAQAKTDDNFRAYLAQRKADKGGRDAYQRDYDSSVSGMGRRERENDEGNTEPPNNFAVSINGKQWKVFKGRGQYADDSAERNHYQQLRAWAAKKSESTGKKWEVHVTGAPATESIQRTQGESMSNLREGEVQQASAIVTAKTMVDRVSRWIEELSSMENDTLLQLGDSIRDEMGQEQAKAFISSVAPAIQQALENLKSTRETMATGVRQLTGEEQGAEMLGGEPAGMGGDEMGPAEPDAMNMGDEMGGEDEFAAAEPAAGGLGDAGREQRESINRSSSLLKVLAG